MEVINGGMRKVIKGMVVTCQTAQFVSLMPKPKDFVTRLVGDVVYLSSEVQKVSDNINKLLDQYADIPRNYLMTQVNSVLGSANSLVNRVNIYTQNGVNQVMNIGENAMNTILELSGGAVDMVNETSNVVTSLAGSVSHSGSALLGQVDIAEEIQSATEVIMEWTGDGFKEIKKSVTEPIQNVVNNINDKKNQINNSINDIANNASDSINKAQSWVEDLLKNLREQMDRLSSKLDGGFKDVTGISSISKGVDFVTEALKESNNDSKSSQVTAAISSSINDVLKNFSISKVVKAFGGILVQSVIVKTGLDELPPIDFESMLCEIHNDLEITNEDLFKNLNMMSKDTYNDIVEFGKSLSKLPSESKEYSSQKYDEFKKRFNDDIKKQREDIRLAMKNSKSMEGLTSEQYAAKMMEDRKAMKSAIKEMKKFRKQIKNAKQSSKLIELIKAELNGLKKETEYRCNSIKSDWMDMMSQYKNAISEIKGFFINGGDGDMFIDDCCDRINQDCNDIKELCKNLTTQLIACTIKIPMPGALPAVAPNPIYSIANFWMDIKTIIKFIKDLIGKIIDILNHINKIARIMLNGFNNLKDIISQLMEALGLKWFIDLIQSIINLFGGKIKDARLLLENMLSPVYYKDTKEYEETLDALESMVGDNEESLTNLQDDVLKKLEDSKSRFYTIDSKRITSASKNDKKYDELIDELEAEGEKLVAYKSPIIKYDDKKEKSVSDMMNGEEIDSDFKFIGWRFYHPDLSYDGSSYYSGKGLFSTIMRKIKSKVIKKAAEKSQLKNGGIAKLRKTKVYNSSSKHFDSGYDAFYWYTYYTEDLEKDCYEFGTSQGSVIIDNTIQTQNGTIVTLNDGRMVFVADNMVRSGDYVNVDGVKYRVK